MEQGSSWKRGTEGDIIAFHDNLINAACLQLMTYDVVLLYHQDLESLQREEFERLAIIRPTGRNHTSYESSILYGRDLSWSIHGK
jgi:hypothetical protein